MDQSTLQVSVAPSPKIVMTIAIGLCRRTPSKNWPARFVKCHEDALSKEYLKLIDLVRHKADVRASYEQYFTAVARTIERYNITAENVYNMDEKGFMIEYL